LQAQYDYSFATQGFAANEVQAACSFLADLNLSGTDLLDAMSQAADVLLANASSANVGCLDSSGFNNPTYNLSFGNVDAWEYQVGLVNARAGYHMQCSIICIAAVNATCKHGSRHSWTNGQILLPCISFCLSLGCLLALCFRLFCAAGVHSASATYFI